jgi:hypothetical protein
MTSPHERECRFSILVRSTEATTKDGRRTYERILASMSSEVAKRYGFVEIQISDLEQQILAAIAAKDWTLAVALTAQRAGDRRPPT